MTCGAANAAGKVGATPPAALLVTAGRRRGAAFQRPGRGRRRVPAGAAPWSEAASPRRSPQGHPVFVYFTADWCLTCKVNEAAAIDRDAVHAAFRKAGVKMLVGDWTNGDPAITRFLESRGRAGVPLYLWYEPGKQPEELPQVLTPGDAHARARRVAALGSASTPSSRQPRFRSTSVRASACAIDLARIAVDEDEVGPFAGL